MVSKVLAGGLSAGVFLLWWPAHFPDEGLQWLVLRGALWALSFELLVLAVEPVERKLLGRKRPPRRAMIGAVVVLIVPILLLTDAKPVVETKAEPRETTVVKRVVVRRPVVEREVVVREVPVEVPVAVPERVASVRKPEPKRVERPEPRVVEAEPKPEPEPEPVEPEAEPAP